MAVSPKWNAILPQFFKNLQAHTPSISFRSQHMPQHSAHTLLQPGRQRTSVFPSAIRRNSGEIISISSSSSSSVFDFDRQISSLAQAYTKLSQGVRLAIGSSYLLNLHAQSTDQAEAQNLFLHFAGSAVVKFSHRETIDNTKLSSKFK